MRLLYAIDLRSRDMWRLDEVARWATALSATVDLVFVDPFGTYMPYVLDPSLADHLKAGLEKSREQDRALLREALHELPEPARGDIHLLSGDPATHVCELAQDFDALVVTTHGRTGAVRMWLGSVAERIVRAHRGDTIVLHR